MATAVGHWGFGLALKHVFSWTGRFCPAADCTYQRRDESPQSPYGFCKNVS